MSEENSEIEELKAAIEVLSAKNRELLGEARAAKAKAKGVEIDPSEYAALQSEVEALRTQLDKSQKEAAKQIDGLNKALQTKDGALQNYLIDNGLNDALLKAGVRPEMMPAVKAMLKSQTKLQEAEGQYSALMGDKPLMDAVAEWAAGDEGKHFVSAPANSGGGAPGGQSANAQSPAPKGNLGGDKSQRVNALKNRFPELAQ
jgi:chromosome segregation ATPase